MSRSSKLKRVYSLPFEGPPPNALFARSSKPVGKPQICWRITKRPSIPDQAFSIIEELKTKQQFPVVVKAPPAASRVTQPPSTSPVRGTTSDYYTGSHSDSSANSGSYSFNATKESADKSISMSVKKLELNENTSADVSMSCHDEPNMLSANSGFEEEDCAVQMSPLDAKEVKDSQKMLSKEVKKHSQCDVEKETQVLSEDIMPPLEDGSIVKKKQQDCMPRLENGLVRRSPKSRKTLLLEKLNEVEQQKRMTSIHKEKTMKSRATGFCPSPQLKGKAKETKTSESQTPATLSTMSPAHQSPLKNDQELRTECSSTFSTPKPSEHSSTVSTPMSTRSIHRKLKLAASFCGVDNTVGSSKQHPSTCPPVLRSRSAIPKETQHSVDTSPKPSASVNSPQQQSNTSTRILQEQVWSTERKIGAMEKELSEVMSNTEEEDLPPWDEERLATLDQFIQLKIKAGMKAKFAQQRSAELSKYKQQHTSPETDLKLKHSTLQTEERGLRTVLQLYY